jgi:hypothetical protein
MENRELPDMSRRPFIILKSFLILLPVVFPWAAGAEELAWQDPELKGEPEDIPLGLKIAYSAFVAVLVPIYWVKWGPGNFLWFSDIALFGALAAVWLGSSLIASMMALAVLLPELIWNVEFFFRLLTRKKIIGLTGYMFDSSRPLYLRALSLFHVILPALLLWLLFRLGYDSRAWLWQTGLAWIVLPLSYLLTAPEENVNWVFGPGDKPQKKLHPHLYLAVVMLFFPLVVYLPTHFLLQWLFGEA